MSSTEFPAVSNDFSPTYVRTHIFRRIPTSVLTDMTVTHAVRAGPGRYEQIDIHACSLMCTYVYVQASVFMLLLSDMHGNNNEIDKAGQAGGSPRQLAT